LPPHDCPRPQQGTNISTGENIVPNAEDEIRRRAYSLYEQHGREDGHDVEDWPRAEEEVKQQTRTRPCLSDL